MMTVRAPIVALGLGCMLLGCGPATVANPGASEASTSAGSSTGAGAMTSTTTGAADPTTSTGALDSGSTSAGQVDDDTGPPPPAGFLNQLDVSVSYTCDVWAENCPVGEKCMPVANDGGSSWNASECRPVVGSPDAIGELCSLTMGSGVDGYDTCEKHAMCWDVDPDTGEGTCVGMCVGTESTPTCLEPDSTCSISSSGVLNLCFPTCDPLGTDCVDGEACYPSYDGFVCAPVAPPEGGGGLAGACEYINACLSGLYCGQGGEFCEEGAYACCLPFCDLTEPDCPAPLDCIAVFESGEGPPGFDQVGFCSAG